ncbi:hypothetical protein WICMUC_002291 [Wickerhamomyces mucosus]|uniref:ESCRT-II complex subunit VPS25 n=1 Tax=Wickerhamomyces mucosus TaxID=1378264 RepID=A0A9P8TEU7_9ASCO|nr:hypothetical protein WICMUC_002291 [Wickerhamomyces mucosus]
MTNIQQQFKFPSIYNFPPFFTRQPNEQTWLAQRQKWIQLILDYSRFNRVWILSDRGKILSQGNVDEDDEQAYSKLNELNIQSDDDDDDDDDNRGIFVNSRVDRSLDVSTINEIFKEMSEKGDATYVSTPQNKKTKTRNFNSIYINWNRSEDWASMLLEWVEKTGQTGTVLTLYEIANGDGSIGQEFHGIHPKILENALEVLVKRGRAQVLKDELNRVAGVKIQ